MRILVVLVRFGVFDVVALRAVCHVLAVAVVLIGDAVFFGSDLNESVGLCIGQNELRTVEAEVILDGLDGRSRPEQSFCDDRGLDFGVKSAVIFPCVFAR